MNKNSNMLGAQLHHHLFLALIISSWNYLNLQVEKMHHGPSIMNEKTPLSRYIMFQNTRGRTLKVSRWNKSATQTRSQQHLTSNSNTGSNKCILLSSFLGISILQNYRKDT